MKRNAAFTLVELLIVIAVIAVLAAIAVPNFLEAQTRSKISRTRGDMAVVAAALRAYFADYNQYPPNGPEVRDLLKAWQETEAVDSVALAEEQRRAAEAAAAAQSPDMASSATAAALSTPAPTPTPTPAPAYGYGYGYGYGGYPGNPSPPSAEPPHPLDPLFESGWDLKILTTPIAYFTRNLPIDAFGQAMYRSQIVDAPFQYFNFGDALPKAFTAGADKARRSFVLLSDGPDRQPYYAGDERGPAYWRNPVHAPLIAYDPTNGTASPGDLAILGDFEEYRSAEMEHGPAPTPRVF